MKVARGEFEFSSCNRLHSTNLSSPPISYYADESVNCEVFHYCQENQKHSWVCPEGFVFHQVHLICMPPSGDNICSQSSKYHIVNDFLYKAINIEEHETKPNVSLKYSERYYPEDIYHDERQEQDEEEYPIRNDYRRQPVGSYQTPPRTPPISIEN